MIIRLNSEANLVKATEVKLIKTSDYQDTLTFKLPLDEKIFVDELIGVRTKVMKQDYRVKEIITKDRFKDVYCEHKFFDCKNIIIPFVDEANRVGESYNDFSRYNSLQSIVAHLNRIMRTKGDTEFKFSTDIDKSGVVECDDTPLFDLIFGEKGILKTFNVELVYDNYKVKFVEKRPSKNTEILFHESKNVSELQETVDFKGIVTKLHVTCKYTPDKTEEGKAERERLRAEKRRELFNKSQEKIRVREERQAQERALRRQKQEEAYQASRTAPKKTREQIHAEHLQKQQDTENRILANNAARRQAREQKFNEREQQRVSRAQDKDDLIFRTVFVSPLVNRYARPYEASLNFQSSEINSEAALIAWCNANLFTDEDTRDVPLRNFSFKPAEDDYNVDINDRAMVNFTSIGTTKIVHCCKIEYDALHDKYLNIEFGVLNKSAIRETIGNLNSKISETNSNISRAYDILDKNFDDYVQKELEAYSELYNIDRGEIEDTINQGFEDAKIVAEKVYGNINTDIENKLAPIREEVRTTVEAYNQQLEATKKELENNRTTSLEQLKELTNRVNNVQDISTNPTVLELKQQVAEAKESGNAVKSKVTELEGSITREFTSVKSKTENDLNVVKSEFTKGVDGLTRKVSSLEEYKNQDGSRTESLKQWVQRDTASQLSRERTEITRIVDSRGYVKNTEFSSKFNDNAQGINRKLDALETYKNQDGTRTSALKQWTQDNTANQLATARRSIESWVDNKGYITTSVLNNKVQETANSFSREISNVREVIKDKVLSNDNLLLGTKDFIPKHFAPAAPWQRPLVWENETERYNDFAVKSTIYQFNGLWQDVAVEKGKTYEYGFFAKGSRYTNKIMFSPGWPSDDAKRPLAEYSIRDTEFTLTTSWKFHSFRFTVTSSGWSQCRVEKTEENNGIKLSVCGLYLREVKNSETSPLGWKPAFEDEQLSINELNTWKQTANQTLNTVTNTLNDTVRHSQLQITADSINFGSSKVFNGQNLASMLSVSPDSIKAITNKLIIAPANENLVRVNQRESILSGERDTFITDDIKEKLNDGEEFYFKAKFSSNGRSRQSIGLLIHVTYTDNSKSWTFSEIYPSSSYIWNENKSVTLKFEKSAGKEVKYYAFGIHQPSWSDFSSWTIKDLELYKKKSAELIVDGTIEGKHIKSSTIETGHLKAGSVTANIIATDAITSNHLNVDDAMIDKLVSNTAFVTNLWSKEAFINSLQTVKIKSTQIDTESLRGARITGGVIDGGVIKGEAKIQIGEHGYMMPSGDGLRFCLPERPSAKRGVGVQMLGNYGRDGNSAYGLYVYVDPNFDTREVSSTNSYLMTVNGYILTKGINNLKFINYNDGSSSIGAWDKDVSLLFDRADNDIFYQWKNKYSLWNIINHYYNSTSDARLKKDIKKCDYKALDLIDDFNFKSFNWKYHEEFGQKPYTEIGLIAQEVEKINKNFVSMAGEYKTLNQFNLLTYSLKAIQELSTQNKELQNRISKLEGEING